MIKPIIKSIKNKKLNKSRNLTKSKKFNKTRKFKSTHLMKGGDDRTTGLPAAYHNGTPSGLKGYYSPGSSELKPAGGNFPVSQGTLWSNGSMAGPNLYPTRGGGCGCSGKKNKNKKLKSHKSRKSHKSHKTNKKNKN